MRSLRAQLSLAMMLMVLLTVAGISFFANLRISRAFEDYIARHNLHDKVDFRGCLCTGRCGEGPNIEIAGRAYQRVDAGVLLDILDRVFAHREDAQ